MTQESQKGEAETAALRKRNVAPRAVMRRDPRHSVLTGPTSAGATRNGKREQTVAAHRCDKDRQHGRASNQHCAVNKTRRQHNRREEAKICLRDKTREERASEKREQKKSKKKNPKGK